MSERNDSPFDSRWTIRKRFDRWEVFVPAGAVAVIPFVAPFRSYDRAVRYVAYWLDHG